MFVEDVLWSWIRHSVIVRRQLTCDSQIEVAYYSAKIGLMICAFICFTALSLKEEY